MKQEHSVYTANNNTGSPSLIIMFGSEGGSLLFENQGSQLVSGFLWILVCILQLYWSKKGGYNYAICDRQNIHKAPINL